ncbi:hypothetical protein ABTE17_20210, partial [Acinetobacter baumannii]
MAEETNAAAHGLSDQASRLAALVSRFRLEQRDKLRKAGDIWTPAERAKALGPGGAAGHQGPSAAAA